MSGSGEVVDSLRSVRGMKRRGGVEAMREWRAERRRRSCWRKTESKVASALIAGISAATHRSIDSSSSSFRFSRRGRWERKWSM